MLTIENLREYGANVDEGMKRCLDKEDLYLKLVGVVIKEQGFENLKNTIHDGNFDLAFGYAHALKGALANLSLSPLADTIGEITDHLREKEEMDYEPLIQKMDEEFNELVKLAEE